MKVIYNDIESVIEIYATEDEYFEEVAETVNSTRREHLFFFSVPGSAEYDAASAALGN